ncbi:MAG: biotin/lipoyl-containing protein, partial [Pseudomonadota bacterium]
HQRQRLGRRADPDQAEAEGVPVLPGLNDPGADDAALIAAAPGIGFPLMVKARAGGGGRGMRRVDAAQALPEALRLARGEAATAFGDDALILERALDGARHVEVQVLADAHGAVLTLGERDCSAQRRRQKVLEEAPAPGLSQAARAALAEAARRLTRAGGYVNAGTAEFLVSPGGEAFFLEMNARLQVEHPVTEAVTGLDLVALQLRVAAGRPLGLSQEDVRLHGHAVEARLCAEDPAAGFLPSAGPILGWRMPTGEGLRVDAGYAEGAEVPAVYDSLLAKVVAWGETREIALARLTAALARTAVLGPRSNAAFLREAAGHRDFAAGGVATTWLEAALPAPVDAPASEAEAAMAAALVLEAAAASAAAAGGLRAELRGWSSDAGLASRLTLGAGEARFEFSARPIPGGWRVAGEAAHEIVVEAAAAGRARLRCGGETVEALWTCDGEAARLALGPRQLSFAVLSAGGAAAEAGADGRVEAPMHGRLVSLEAAEGDAVAKGDLLAVLEAMKMQHRLTAPVAGRVARIHRRPGDQTAAGDPILDIEPDPDPDPDPDDSSNDTQTEAAP